ncbi:MAG: hypothetical protein ACYCZM_08675 [Acidimicrobiales bacterium]
MHRSLVERRITEVTSRLKRARQELVVLDEQLNALTEAADEARIRSLVSETPLANKEYQEAQRHADALKRSREAALAAVAGLQSDQDELLERLAPGPN